MFQRIHVIVLDSLGVGQAPDAAQYGDSGADTFGHIAAAAGLSAPCLAQLGLGNPAPPKGYAARLQERSTGKDTMTGHWELMGLVTTEPFPVYPQGFPPELLHAISEFSGRGVLCNQPYSGTKVIEDYGPQQLQSGALIIYTSADPVLQIAAHQDVIPLEELYRICEYTRSITTRPPWMVSRIIARPYTGKPGCFQRTSDRHDYAVDPPGKTLLDHLKANGLEVAAIGKIRDIFNGNGVTSAVHTSGNMDGVDQLLRVMNGKFRGISFTNLVDFDSMYGHRRDPQGYARAIEEFDARIPELLAALRPDDLLMITADHGNDPTFPGTDHTREYVPLLAFSPAMQAGGRLPDGHFSDVAATIADNFHLQVPLEGRSLLPLLR